MLAMLESNIDPYISVTLSVKNYYTVIDISDSWTCFLITSFQG